MSKTIERLSSNLFSIINKTLYNELLEDERDRQIVSQLIRYDNINPLSQPVLTKEQCKSLFLSRVFPYPIDTYTDTIKTDIRIYSPECEFDSSGAIEDYVIVFDIIVHQDYYLIRDNNNNPKFRPHVIAQHIMDFFNDKNMYAEDSGNTVGKLVFRTMMNINYDDKYQGTRLVARLVDFVTER